MLFHSLAGSEMRGVIDQMDRRSKADAPAITSAIDRGEIETVGRSGGPEFKPGKDSGRGRSRFSASQHPRLRSTGSPEAASDGNAGLGSGRGTVAGPRNRARFDPGITPAKAELWLCAVF